MGVVLSDEVLRPDAAEIRRVVGEDAAGVDFDGDPEFVEERKERDPLIAPYRRIRNEGKMYPELGGSISGELIGCGFACRQCWSSYGLAGKDNMVWMTAEQVAQRLIDGATKSERKIIRMSHGEPFLYPEHLLAVAEHVLAADIPNDPIFQIETNGLWATPEWIDKLNELAGKYPDKRGWMGSIGKFRIGMWWSIKSTTALTWSWHTGRLVDEHEDMWMNWEHTAKNATNIGLETAVIAQFMEDSAEGNDLEELRSYAEDLRKGLSNHIYVENHKIYFPYERPIDRRMGERRLRTIEEDGMFELDGQPPDSPFSRPWIVGNGIFPPFPKPRR